MLGLLFSYATVGDHRQSTSRRNLNSQTSGRIPGKELLKQFQGETPQASYRILKNDSSQRTLRWVLAKKKKTHAGNPQKKPRRISEDELLEESPEKLSGEFPEKKKLVKEFP